ncbi:hypothetical protein V8E36_007657 [Tilletia maclaganii]
MPALLPTPSPAQLARLRQELAERHPLWGQLVHPQELTQRSLNWTVSRRVGEDWVPLTAEDRNLIADDGVRHFQSFQGLRNHLAAQTHPKIEAVRPVHWAKYTLWAALAVCATVAAILSASAFHAYEEKLRVEGCERPVPMTAPFCEAAALSYRGAAVLSGALFISALAPLVQFLNTLLEA